MDGWPECPERRLLHRPGPQIPNILSSGASLLVCPTLRSSNRAMASTPGPLAVCTLYNRQKDPTKNPSWVHRAHLWAPSEVPSWGVWLLMIFPSGFTPPLFPFWPRALALLATWPFHFLTYCSSSNWDCECRRKADFIHCKILKTWNSARHLVGAQNPILVTVSLPSSLVQVHSNIFPPFPATRPDH